MSREILNTFKMSWSMGVGHDEPVRVIVLADTHAPRRWRSCPPAVAGQLRGVDLILHAGDVCTAATLDELAGYAPVRAVRGNNDGPDVAAWGAPDTAELELAGLTVAMLHDAGPAAGAGPAAAPVPRRRPGHLRALAHPAGPHRERPADLQPGLAD